MSSRPIPASSARRFSERLLHWYEQHGRKDLPWQKKYRDKNLTAYRVWLSEIMLQQTQVATVIPYYEKFIVHYPTLEDLAAAPLDDVLHLWSGLGYYARGRNLHAAARRFMEHYGGRIPDTVEELGQLPGIGPSTAGAIVSLAYGRRATILDGNVKRVLARHFLLEGAPQGKNEKNFWVVAESLTPTEGAQHYTQAIMDLGATLCTRSQPRCPACPLKSSCAAHKQGRQRDFPERPVKRRQLPVKEVRMLLVTRPGPSLYLAKRPASGIWGGLWSLPELDLEQAPGPWCEDHFGVAVRKTTALENLSHSFSHYHLRIHPLWVELAAAPRADALGEGASDHLWYNFRDGSRQALKKGLAAPVSKLIEQLARSHP